MPIVGVAEGHTATNEAESLEEYTPYVSTGLSIKATG